MKRAERWETAKRQWLAMTEGEREAFRISERKKALKANLMLAALVLAFLGLGIIVALASH